MAAIVTIVGGGPAGMSCALWLSNYGLRALIIEKEPVLGGMVRRNPYPDRSLLGRPVAHAREHAEEFARHIQQAGIECWLGAEPTRINRQTDGGFRLDVAFSDGRKAQSLPCATIVIATGTDFRGAEWLDRVKNAQHLAALGRVHVGASWAGEPGVDLGSHVAIVGGGDNAFDVADILVRKGVKVTVVMRAKAPVGQRALIERVAADAAAGMAQIMVERSVEELAEAGGQVALRLNDGSTLMADHVLVLFGYRANTGEPWLTELALNTDASGYLIVDANMETSCSGVFAVGDVSNPLHPCIATALGSGTMAAREIQKRLSRSGSVSV